MTISAQYFKNTNFIKTTISGQLNDKDLFAHVKNLNELTAGLHSVLELADCRKVTDISRLTADGVEYCSSYENDKPGSRLVILVEPDQTTFNVLAGIYEASSENFREQVVVLNQLDDAIDWLTDNPEEQEKIRALYTD